MKAQNYILYFFIAYLFSTVSSLSPYLEYIFNKAYIVTELCVNRDKVEMNCEGKCYLNKELKKAIPNSHKSETESSVLVFSFDKFFFNKGFALNSKEETIHINVKKTFVYSFSLKPTNLEVPTQPPDFIV